MNRNFRISKTFKNSRLRLAFFLEFILFASFAVAQDNGTERELLSAYNQYRSQYIQEKLYAHTDRNSYLTKEIIWFRIYYVDAAYNKPASVSKIAYVEILDRNNRPVLQQKVSLKPGESNGSIAIPSNTPSGTYKFRAYTNWMKNFGPDYFFEKPIRIINPQALQSDSTLSNTNRYDIQFFPEGGNLVQNIETKVGFRVTDAYGKGLECEGILLNSKADTVLKFRPLHLGLGNFVFTPVAGQSYKALIRFPQGESVLKDLPAIYPNGYVMNLAKINEGRIAVTVRASPDLYGRDLFLFIHGSHALVAAVSGKPDGQSVRFLIEPKDLQDGINQFTLFDNAGHPVCERLFFKYPENRLTISAAANEVYGTRKKIDLNLVSSDQSGSPVAANMSLAVYRLDSLQIMDELNIRNYLYLSSDLGPVQSPGFYFADAKSKEEDMDNLMLTQGWRRYNWKNIVSRKPVMIEYAPEFNGHIVSGKAIDNKTGAMVPNTDAYISVPSTRAQFRNTSSDAAGNLKFELTGFYGSEELIVQTDTKRDSTVHIEIENPFSQKYSAYPLPEYIVPDKNSGVLLDRSIAEQVQNLYSRIPINRFVMQKVDTNNFYVTADEKYMLDDYTRFLTMEEVIREYVRSSDVTRKKDRFMLQLSDDPHKRFFEGPPLILIDGVPFFDPNELFQQDPKKIKRLDLVSREYVLGFQTFDGVINLTTYHGDLEGIQMNPRATVLDYPGIPEERQFFSPVYETEDQIASRMPDFRTVLYWKPQIVTGADGKKTAGFYTSDIPGKYAVVVQGLTENGDPGSEVIYFDVKK
jgi:hypothetical protein